MVNILDQKIKDYIEKYCEENQVEQSVLLGSSKSRKHVISKLRRQFFYNLHEDIYISKKAIASYFGIGESSVNSYIHSHKVIKAKLEKLEEV